MAAISTIEVYKSKMSQVLQMILPISEQDLSPMIDYSINKRCKDSPCQVVNTYTNKTFDMTLLRLSDYILSKEPIVTAFGTMFSKHADTVNPMAVVIQQFLDDRNKDKKMMFKFPKGSEQFEHYNLLQQLDKIFANSIYGCIGMYTSAIFNVNVATSVTSQGRALISSATLMLEAFLANNVKFGSLNEVMEFIDNIRKEKRVYNDLKILDKNVTIENCFAKIIDECGYRWIPNEKEMDLIWIAINNLGQEDINRVYYKNNLYEFMSNSSMIKAIKYIMKDLNSPFFNSLEPPENVVAPLEELCNIVREYVFYNHMYIDRIDRCDNMIKSVIAVSDTDSVIVSMDAWYHFALEYLKDEDLKITKYDPINILAFAKKDEFGDDLDLSKWSALDFEEAEEDYDFVNDEIIQKKKAIDPLIVYPQDYLRYSIINIMVYIVGVLMNENMVQFSINNHSWTEDKKCKLFLKTEFSINRMLLTLAKKNYADYMVMQEGNIIPEDSRLDIKGIASMAKSSMSESTRNQLKKILLEDILNTPIIDQFKVIKDLAIFERKIVKSIRSGSKEYYKPVAIKSISNYKDPMRIQGIKASVVWNNLKPDNYPGINLEERNSVNIAKIIITESSIKVLKDSYPDVYDRAVALLKDPVYKGKIDSVAIPHDTNTPDWVMDIINYDLIVNDNISGFPYESVGIVKLSGSTNYSNILQV